MSRGPARAQAEPPHFTDGCQAVTEEKSLGRKRGVLSTPFPKGLTGDSDTDERRLTSGSFGLLLNAEKCLMLAFQSR